MEKVLFIVTLPLFPLTRVQVCREREITCDGEGPVYCHTSTFPSDESAGLVRKGDNL